MPGPHDWQPLWERRDLDDHDRTARDDASTASAAARLEAVRQRLPILGAALLVVFIVVGVMRAIMGLFAVSGHAQPFALNVCATRSFGERTAVDLMRGFLRSQGATAVRPTADEAGVATLAARLPGLAADTTFTVQLVDAATGFDRLTSRRCQVAIASREITPIEGARFHTAPIADLFALDGAVVVTHPANPVRALTLEELRAAMSGAVTDWSAFGGERRRVAVMLPDAQADELSALIARALDGRAPTARYRRTDDVAFEAAAPLAHGALGVTTFHASDPARLVRLVDAAGRQYAPSTLSIGRRTYPLTMPVYAYADEASMGNAAYRFLLYLGSAEGQGILVDDGFISPSTF